MNKLAETLDALSAPAELVLRQKDGSVRCLACAHRCLVRPMRRGICQVRFHDGRELRMPWGYVAGLHADPVEKKPFYHIMPGATALTFGMLGCDLHCGFCQNWLTSQTLRDAAAQEGALFARRIQPEEIIQAGLRSGATLLASSYNEPLITSEWAQAIFRQGKQAGMKCVFVSNGNATAEVLDYMQPTLAGMKIDLKTMQDRNYRRLGAVLNNILDTIQRVHALGMWLEVVTLVIPGFNDSTSELWEAARFMVSVSPDIPWHVTAFHPDYQMTGTPATPPRTLLRAAEIGREAGLHHVYAGNLPGRVEEYENTTCPGCQTMLIERRGYHVGAIHLEAGGKCPKCGRTVAGIWD